MEGEEDKRNKEWAFTSRTKNL